MKYLDLYNYLKDIENYIDNEIIIDEHLVIRNFTFVSNRQYLLPGGIDNSGNHEYTPVTLADYEPDVIQEMLNKKDSDIEENIEFRYHIIMPLNQSKSKKIVLMFHGFNEKYWSKYLPWAKYIADKIGKAVVMFPIAFHMNRAPSAWSNPREMFAISCERKLRHPIVICSSLSNVAISTRLHNKPQRFIWSGLQSYYDIIDFVEDIKTGNHPAIAPDATIDFFSYSIGTFLGEILMMSNKNGYFTQSKFAAFCGGAVFNRLSPVSKFILDSEANVSLYSFVVEHLQSHMKQDRMLYHYMNTNPEGINFQCMLNYKTLPSYREAIFRKMSGRFYCIVLEKDGVVPPYEAMNTLQGRRRDIPIKIDVLDYPYRYTHENPFPQKDTIKEEVDIQFRRTFDRISHFLSDKKNNHPY